MKAPFASRGRGLYFVLVLIALTFLIYPQLKKLKMDREQREAARAVEKLPDVLSVDSMQRKRGSDGKIYYVVTFKKKGEPLIKPIESPPNVALVLDGVVIELGEKPYPPPQK